MSRLSCSVLLLPLLFCGSLGNLWGDGDSDNSQQTTNNGNRDFDDARPKYRCASTSRVCSNFHAEVAKAINIQIGMELNASYTYMSMGHYFDRDDQALRGFSKAFLKMSEEERSHAQLLITYMNKRGGTVAYTDITKPGKEEWGSGLQAMKDALHLEHLVNNKLLDLHWMAQQRNDVHLQDYLESVFLTEQVDSISQLAHYVSILERTAANPLGEIIFDQELYEGER